MHTAFLSIVNPLDGYVHGLERYLHVASLAYRLVGGENNTLPVQYLEFANSASPRKYQSKFSKLLPHHRNAHQSCGEPYDTGQWRKCLSAQVFSDTTPVQFVSLRTAAQLPPIGYSTYILGAACAMLLHGTPLTVLYSALITNVVILLLMGFCAIRISPILQWPMTILLLLPSVVAMRSFIMPDGLLIGSCYLFFALVFALRVKQQSLTVINKALLLVLGTVIGVVKAVYFFLPAMAAILPFRQLASTRVRAMLFIVCILGSSIVAANIWNAKVLQNYFGIDLDNIENATSMSSYSRGQDDIDADEILTMVNDPLPIAEAIYSGFTSARSLNSIMYNFVYWKPFYFPDRKIHDQGMYFFLFGFFLILSAISEPSRVAIYGSDRILFVSLVLVTYTLLGMVMWLLHGYITVDGDSYVRRLQGRYFLPFIPLILAAFHVRWLDRGERKKLLLHRVSIATLLALMGLFYCEYFKIGEMLLLELYA